LANAAREASQLQVSNAGPEVPHARHDHGVRAQHLLRIARDLGGAPHALDRSGDRAEVAHAVVEDRDLHSAPLVDGGPALPVGSTARPRATASALNSASTTWWGERPRSKRRCTVSPPVVANARTKSSVSPVS